MELRIAQALQRAIDNHQKGRFEDAARLYRAILQVQPDHPDANHNLGVLSASKGDLVSASSFFKHALQVKPSIEQFWLSHIHCLIKQKKFDDATLALSDGNHAGVSEERFDTLRTLLSSGIAASTSPSPSREQLNNLFQHYHAERLSAAEPLALLLTQEFPGHSFAWRVLGAIFNKTLRFTDALAAMQKSVELLPNDAEAHFSLGNVLEELGRFEEAEASYLSAIALKPDFSDAHNNLGNTLKNQGRLTGAEASYAQAIELRPDYAEANYNLGIALKMLVRLEEAAERLARAIALKPDLAQAHYNLGHTLQALDRLNEAEASYTQAITIKPDYAQAYSNLGTVLQELGRPEEAEANYKKAIALNPEYAEAFNNLGNVLKDLGRFGEAKTSYMRALKLNPDYLSAHNNLLMQLGSMQFDAVYYQTHARNFSKAVSKNAGLPFTSWSYCRGQENLRIGFVSGDFKSHPVGYFLEGLLSQLQSSSVEMYAYSAVDEEDDMTERLRGLFHSWSLLTGLSDEDAAQKICSDGIHILIDLSGHTAHNRLPVFAWKPAPIQVSWLGYFASTGLPEMDYILGDPYVTPYEEASHFTEKIWQLPDSYLCFTPPLMGCEVNALPALANGYVTFGCFNKVSRMTDEVVLARAKILHAVPNSKLFLKDKQLGYSSGRDRILSRFSAHGITADRLILEGKSTRDEYLVCYHRVDIALSPFPYGGGTTSVEGLWMGVPVIAKRGTHFLSHLGESIAHNSGLSDWIAVDEEEYVSKAVQFSSDLPALAALRIGLRDQVLQAPLFDAPRFARHFEQAVWSMRRSLG